MKKVVLWLLGTCLLLKVQAQPQVLDKVVAVVGNEIILYSELETEYYQAKKQLENITPEFKCNILDQLIQKKLLLHKARLDSLPVTDDRLDAEIERKIQFYSEQIGGEKQLEAYLGKSILEYKTGIRDKMRDQMLIQDMESKVTKDIKATPIEVRRFFTGIPDDSIPLISSDVEIAQIVVLAQVSKEAKDYAYSKISDIRQQIINGADFGALARTYSEDPLSAVKDGELGEFGRNQMVAAFEAAAFKLRPDSISKVIETPFGYHILKLIDRRGERINVRHILIRPKTTRYDLQEAKRLLDSIVWQVKIDSLTFEAAAKKFSDDKQTKNNGGYFQDPNTGSTHIPVSALDGPLVLAIENMKVNGISAAEYVQLPDGSEGYRVLYLKSETKPHKMNMEQDYQRIQTAAQQQMQQDALLKWSEKQRLHTYIKIDPLYSGCAELAHWLNKTTATN